MPLEVSSSVRVAVLAAVLLVGLNTRNATAADVLDDVPRNNRDQIASDYWNSEDPLVPVPLVLRAPTKKSLQEPVQSQPGFIEKFFGGQTKATVPVSPDPTEVLARKKSGELVAIGTEDRPIAGIIQNGVGEAIGYLTSRTTKDGPWSTAGVSFTIYLASQRGLVARSGEFTCKKIDGEGPPIIGVPAATWRDAGDLAVALRSSCVHVSAVGAATSRIFNMFSGKFSFDKELKGNSTTDTSQTMVVRFKEDLSYSFEEDTDLKLTSRAHAKCVNAAKKKDAFTVCGKDGELNQRVIWRHQGMLQDIEFCDGAEAAGPNFLVKACNSSDIDKDGEVTKQTNYILIAHEALPKLEYEMSCACKRFFVSGLHLDFAGRTLSFNLRTDVKKFDLQGTEVTLPDPPANTEPGVLPVPIFELRFNEKWQLTGIATKVH